MAHPINIPELIAQLEQIIQESNINTKQTLTLEEAAIYTGRSKSNLYKLTSQRLIPHFKPHGSRIYFDRKALESWMRQNPVKTAAQLEQEATAYVTRHPHGRNRSRRA